MVDYEAAVRPKFLALRSSCEPVKGILDEERLHLASSASRLTAAPPRSAMPRREYD